MKNRKLLSIEGVLVFIIFLFLAGCNTTSPMSTPSEEEVILVNSIPASAVPPTLTLLPTELPSATSTLAPAPSSPPTSTSTAQPMATETPFFIATPKGNGVIEQALWLFETNNGCRLPCWWGITPGDTDWQIAQEFLSLFDSNMYKVSGASGLMYYGIRIPLHPEVFLAESMELGILVRDGVVEKIFTDVSDKNTPPGYLDPYTLSMFLTTYGQPTEVWIFTYRSSFEEGDLPFAVALFYSEQGIVALYSDNGESQRGIVQGCPQENPVSFLSLWTPDLDLTFEQVIEGTSALERDYLSLEEASGMDVATFYDTFKNTDNTTCLETPADLWR